MQRRVFLSAVVPCIIFFLAILLFLFWTSSRDLSGEETDAILVDTPMRFASPEAMYTNTTADEITVSSPVPTATISSPLTITGSARGSWYFEATAPVVLVDWDGKIIAEGYVMAQGDWMTEEFVPFIGTLIFTRPSYGDVGALILQADNPSGLPEYDRAVEISIRFE